jgi:hypothetical protein
MQIADQKPRESVTPAGEVVTLYSQELVAKDGRKARVSLRVTCHEQLVGDDDEHGDEKGDE